MVIKKIFSVTLCCIGFMCGGLMSATSAWAVEAATPVEAVDGFHNALKIGDTAAALSLLARDLVVVEFGVIDPTVEAYSFSHMPFDMDMEGATSWTLNSRQVGGTGDTRFVVSSYHVNGQDATGATIDHNVFETAVVTRVGGRFRISHLHWSTDNPQYAARAQDLRLKAKPSTAGEGTPPSSPPGQ